MIKATELGHYYRSGDWLFQDLNFTLEKGEVIAVLGPNARGKTTLLSCLGGVRTPAHGNVSTDGFTGFVPQSHATSYRFSVYDTVLMGTARSSRAWQNPSKQDKALTWQALERVGLAHRGSAIYSDLSGGQRQLVLIARALVSQPTSIILDEPTSALDLRNQRLVMEVLGELALEGMTVIFSTHDPTQALTMAHRTLVLDVDVTLGDSRDVLTAETLTHLYRTQVNTFDLDFGEGLRRIAVAEPARSVLNNQETLSHS
ncbi:ABC transporter ATP-binding protein [Corynebacterium casei]|uniref:ABC transporter ATP-binding protein n=1 Tax=Corynebacterium casei TaxID=160386 RepID=UPI003F91C44C